MRPSIYANLKNDKQYKSSTGLNIAEFEALYTSFQHLYIPKVSNPYNPEKNPVLTDKREALFFILHYYKAYPTLQNLGLYFGFSNFTASQYLDLLKPILKESLHQNKVLCNRLFNNQSEFNAIFGDVKTIMIDVSEVPVERPQDAAIQGNRYSGKKFHTLKWLIVCDKDKRILFISSMYDGKTHDFTIFKAIFSGIDFSALDLYVDLGFLGIKKAIHYNHLYIPDKASKYHPLDAIKKEENSTLSSIRVAVENAIAKLKSFFILRIENRMRIKSKLDEAFTICAALANFKTKNIIY